MDKRHGLHYDNVIKLLLGLVLRGSGFRIAVHRWVDNGCPACKSKYKK